MLRLVLLSLSLLTFSLIIVTASNITPCQYDGMDFSSMNRPTGYEAQDSTWLYRWQICGMYTADSKCVAKSGAVCLYQASNQNAAYVAAYDTAPAPVWSTTDNGAKLTYNNGDIVSGNSPATVNIDLRCGDAETPPTAAFDTTKFIITIVQYTSLACKSDTKTGLSGGWIFIIIVLVSVTIYIVFGCLYKFKRQGTRGVESCPNIDFWRELPRLVKDGCFFTFVKLRGLCGASHASMGAKSEYDNLK